MRPLHFSLTSLHTVRWVGYLEYIMAAFKYQSLFCSCMWNACSTTLDELAIIINYLYSIWYFLKISYFTISPKDSLTKFIFSNPHIWNYLSKLWTFLNNSGQITTKQKKSGSVASWSVKVLHATSQVVKYKSRIQFIFDYLFLLYDWKPSFVVSQNH